MGAGRSSGFSARWLAGLASIAALWWVAFHQDERIPILTYVNFGIHEAGHFVTYSSSDLVMYLAGSIAQVAVPVLLAAYFFHFRSDWLAASVCLMWGATSALEVALYVADARAQRLDLIGGNHDWAFILGPEGYGAMEKSASIANTIRDAATAAAIAAFALCLASPLRGRRRARQSDVAATRRATAA